MKKTTISTLILGILSLLLTACTEKHNKEKTNKFVITGKFLNSYNDSIFFEYGSKKDCTVVNNNTFYFEGQLDSANETEGYLRLKNAANPNVVFIDTGKIDITLQRDSYVLENVTYNDIKVKTVHGSGNHTLWDNWFKFYKENKNKDKAASSVLVTYKLKNTIDSFPKSPINGRILYLYANEMNLNDICEIKKSIDTTSMFTMDINNINTIIMSKIRTQKNSSLKNFILENQNGILEKFYSRTDKFVLVDFWASWCSPCRQQNKELQKLAILHKDRFNIISISLDDDKKSWKQAIAKDNMHWKNFIAQEDWDSEIATYYGITSLPFNILIDRKGNIAGVNLKSSEISSYLKQ